MELFVPFLIIFVSCNREGDRESDEDRYVEGDGDGEGWREGKKEKAEGRERKEYSEE
jgi:hypothetical protein